MAVPKIEQFLALAARVFFATSLCSSALAAQKPPTTAFVNVSVVPMDRDTVLARQTVIITDGKIVAMGPAASTRIPVGSRRIDGTGRYLMPGLADMHVHFIRPAIPGKTQYSGASTHAQENTELALLFVANGVTTVRNMWGAPEILALNDRIVRGDLLGPTIYSTGPITDGDPPVYAGMRVITTEEQARQAVHEDKLQGYIGVKVYNRLAPPVYNAIVEAAATEHIPVMGHVPGRVGLMRALDAHQASIEHFSSFVTATLPPDVDHSKMDLPERLDRANLGRLDDIAARVKAAGSWSCPTVVQVQMEADNAKWEDGTRLLPPDLVKRYERGNVVLLGKSAEPFALALVAALHRAGAGLLLGTDAYKPNVIPGFSLHEELNYFLRAGLSPYEALCAGTVNPARFLGHEKDFGEVAIGQRADLVLLSANPLADVRNVAKRVGVMVRGTWVSEQELQKKLSSLRQSARRIRVSAARYAS
jgi:imidazolonepropionase-like amidohydrolase